MNIYAYIKFGETLLTCSQDIEWNCKSSVNQGP